MFFYLFIFIYYLEGWLPNQPSLGGLGNQPSLDGLGSPPSLGWFQALLWMGWLPAHFWDGLPAHYWAGLVARLLWYWAQAPSFMDWTSFLDGLEAQLFLGWTCLNLWTGPQYMWAGSPPWPSTWAVAKRPARFLQPRPAWTAGRESRPAACSAQGRRRMNSKFFDFDERRTC